MSLAYCEQMSKEEMDAISRKKTADEMLLLGAELQSRIEDKKRNDQTKNLRDLDHHLSLASMLDEYFDLDETHQKAKMLELLTKLTKLEKVNNQLKSSLDELDERYQEEHDRADEMNQQCDSYIEEVEEKETELNQKTQELKKEKRNLIQLKKESEAEKAHLEKSLSESQSHIWSLYFYMALILSLFGFHLNYTYNLIEF